jgi:DsbC/DsbD-like thiol-disulfide interchange protein
VRARVVATALLMLAISSVHDPLAAQSGSARVSRDTPQLKFTASLSARAITPGERLTLTVDIVPKPRMHVYAPGSKYRPIAITMDPQAGLTIGTTTYPKPDSYYFKPLNETVDVYQSPFRLTIDLAATDRAASPFTIKGLLEYQACDDRVCYLPESIPLRWTVDIVSGTGSSARRRQ